MKDNTIFILTSVIALIMASCTQTKNLSTNQDNIKLTNTTKEDLEETEKVTTKLKERNTQDNGVLKETVDMEEWLEPDGAFYETTIQNLLFNNCITYSNGYYYYRSQKDYSLCKIKKDSKEIIKVTDAIPQYIYINNNTIYFLNISDDNKLYSVQTDGSNLRKISDNKMDNLVLVNNKFYFLSNYIKEYDILNLGFEKYDDYHDFLYSMNVDGTDATLIIKNVDDEFTTDGKRIYYKECIIEELNSSDTQSHINLCSSNMNGTDYQTLMKDADYFFYLISYREKLYFTKDQTLYSIDANGLDDKKMIMNEVYKYTISNGKIYTIKNNQLISLNLLTDDKKVITENTLNDYSDIYVVDGHLLLKHWVSEDLGIVWHEVDMHTGEYKLFEPVETYSAKDYVIWSSSDVDYLTYDFVFPELKNEDYSEYLDDDIIYTDYYKEYDGSKIGQYSITVPRFNHKIAGHKNINKAFKDIYEQELENKKNIYTEYEKDSDEHLIHQYNNIQYNYLYLSDQYLSVDFYLRCNTGGRDYIEWRPLLFDRNTGKQLKAEDVFCVDENIYKDRLARILYKYLEFKNSSSYLDVTFEDMGLKNEMQESLFFFSRKGLVVGYPVNSIACTAVGDVKFEIPYAIIEDILNYQWK